MADTETAPSDDEIANELEYLHASSLGENQDMEIGMDPSEMDVSSHEPQTIDMGEGDIGPVTSPAEYQANGPSAPIGAITDPSAENAPPQEVTSRMAETSSRGMDPSKIGMARGFRAGIDDKINSLLEPYAEGAANDMIAGREHVQQGAIAMRREAALSSEFWDTQAKTFEQIHDVNQTAADMWQQSYNQSKADGARYVEGYRQQLAAVRTLMMQDPNPLRHVSAGERSGLVGAAFAQGFLAARGIKIDVLGQIDHWVDRSIAEHQQNIQNARESAGDQLSLYQIARQTSQDDWEARQRFTGMALEAFKAQTQGAAARFQSGVASSRADQAIAEMQAKQDAIERGIRDRIENLSLQARGQELSNAHNMAMETITDRHNKKMEALAEAKKAGKAGTGLGKIPDPGAVVRDKTGKVVGYQNVWKWRDGVKAPIEVQNKVSDASTVYEASKAAVERLRYLRPPSQASFMAKYGGEWGDRFDQARRIYDNEKTLAIMEARHAMAGANLTEREAKDWDAILENDSGWESGNNTAKLSQFEKHMRDKFTTTIHGAAPYIEAVPANERDTYDLGQTGNDTDANYNADLSAPVSHSGPVDEAVTKIAGIEHKDVPKSAFFSPAYKTYVKETGDETATGVTDDRWKRRGQRNEIDGVDMLVALIAKPEMAQVQTVEGQATQSPEDVRNEAVATLQGIAAGQPIDGGKVDEEVQRYAKWHMDHMGEKVGQALWNSVSMRVHDPGVDDYNEAVDEGLVKPEANLKAPDYNSEAMKRMR